MGAIKKRGGKNSAKPEQLNKSISGNKKANRVASPPPLKVKSGKDELSEEEEDTDSSNSYQTDSEEELIENDATSSASSSSMEHEITNTGRQKGYSDDNATWLKLKKRHQEEKEELLSSSSSGSSSEDEEIDEEGEEEEENLMDIERKSKKIEEEMELERLEAEDEMRHVIATQTSVFHLPTPEELEMDKDRVSTSVRFPLLTTYYCNTSLLTLQYVVSFVFCGFGFGFIPNAGCSYGRDTQPYTRYYTSAGRFQKSA